MNSKLILLFGLALVAVSAQTRFQRPSNESLPPPFSQQFNESLIQFRQSAAKVTKTYAGKVFMHLMPWFETRQTNTNGQWGIHWTMATQNPDVVDSTGKRQIAAYYYPDIGPYGSSDPAVIDYQLLLMKYAGVDAVTIDWPGTVNYADLPKNLQNSNAIIAGIQRVGLQFAVVYEDHNIGMAADAGAITDKYGAAKNDMIYLRDNYFNKPNYVQVNGAPLLLDFGPQTFTQPSDWNTIFSVLTTKPTFIPLWYQIDQATPYSKGEFAWIYTDGIDGLRNFYANRQLTVKIGGVYPGFNTFYKAGGWGGPTWTLPYGDNFAQQLDLALQSNLQYIQFNTWNDYGEGTMIEPTREFGTSYLETMQQKLGVPFGTYQLGLIKQLYTKRVANAGNSAKLNTLNQAFNALVNLDVAMAQNYLNQV